MVFNFKSSVIKVTETKDELVYEPLTLEEISSLLPEINEPAVGGCYVTYESVAGGIPYLVCKSLNCSGHCEMHTWQNGAYKSCECVD
jgi:hypothetical protein